MGGGSSPCPRWAGAGAALPNYSRARELPRSEGVWDKIPHQTSFWIFGGLQAVENETRSRLMRHDEMVGARLRVNYFGGCLNKSPAALFFFLDFL